MRYRKLTRSLLVDLKRRGYNVLMSPTLLTEGNPTWRPAYIEDVAAFVDQMAAPPLREPRFLVIDEALSVPAGQLEGSVFIE